MTTQIKLPNVQPTHYIVQTAAARMPTNCWGHYRRVAVLEVEVKYERVAMISPRARGVVRIVRTWEKRFDGKTERCAFAKARAIAHALCNALNKTCPWCKEEHLNAHLEGQHWCYKCSTEWLMTDGKISYVMMVDD